jgi:PAS domain S-box-containing protein
MEPNNTGLVRAQLARTIALAGVLPLVIAIIVWFATTDAQFVNEPLHAAIETAGAAMAIGVALLMWLRLRDATAPRHFIWPCAALVGMGIIDGAHAALPFGLAWSWSRHVATLYGGLIFACVWIPNDEELWRRRTLLLSGVSLFSLLVAALLWWFSEWLPIPFTTTGYTPAAQLTNIIGGAGFLVAACFFQDRYARYRERDDLIFAGLTLLFAVAGLFFATRPPWSALWWMWHGFRFIAYVIVGRAGYLIVSELHAELLRQKATLEMEVERRTRTLRQSEALKSAMLNAGLDAIITIDHERKVIEFNRAAERLFGYAREFAIGKPIEDLIVPPSLREAHIHGMQRFLSTGESRILGRRVELAARRADGSEFPCELAIIPVQLDGPPMFTAFVRDITERKKAQEILERTVAERTAALTETVGQLETFSYSITHDMRGPLRAMTSFAMLLEREHSAALNSEARDYLQRIIDSARRLDRLIQDVLQYSRLARGEFSLETVNLERAVRDVVQDYPDVAAHKDHIQIVTRCADTNVRANVAALTQVVSNLVTNALKFVPPGRTPEVRVLCEDRDGAVRLTVEDNGTGIPPAQREKIFGIFHRLHGTEYPGTGIGLSIVKKAVERMGGRVGVESEAGHGSRFWIQLPRG